MAATDALRIEICAGNDPRRLRVVARKLIEMAEGGDLRAIKEIGDRLDGKRAQVIERGEVSVETLSDAELFAIIRDGSRRPLEEPTPLQICGPAKLRRTAHQLGADLGTGPNNFSNIDALSIACRLSGPRHR